MRSMTSRGCGLGRALAAWATLTLSALGTTGWAQPPFSFSTLPPSPLVPFSSPQVGIEMEVEVGQEVATAGTVSQTVAVRVLNTSKGRDGFGNKGTIEPGLYQAVGSNGKGIFFLSPQPVTFRALGLSENAYGGVFIPNAAEQLPRIWVQRAVLSSGPLEGLQFERTVVNDLKDRGFSRELIYSGVAKGVVTLNYREYSRELARAAFAQSLTYDLSEGDEIGFRGARIRVLKATNTSIRFIVLKPLDGAP